MADPFSHNAESRPSPVMLSNAAWRDLCASVEAVETELTLEGFFGRLMEQLERQIAFDYALVSVPSPDDLRKNVLFLSRHADPAAIGRYLADSIFIDPVLPGIPMQSGPVGRVNWEDYAENDLAHTLLHDIGIRFSLNLTNLNRSPAAGFIVSVHRGGRSPFHKREVVFLASLYPHVNNLFSRIAVPAPDPGRLMEEEYPAAARLTSREKEIAALIANRLSRAEIADRLFISTRTVGKHLEHIYSKLDLAGRRDLWQVIASGGNPPSP